MDHMAAKDNGDPETIKEKMDLIGAEYILHDLTEGNDN
jgi:hypothetical protein